jgi:starch synthase
MSRLRVLHLTAELWPFAQTGGLGQAVAGLAAYQAGMGIDASVLLPLYREARQRAPDLEPFGAPFTVDVGGVREELRCWRQLSDRGPTWLFLEHQPSFDRPGIYGAPDADYHDNHRRFAIFAMGAIEIARRLQPETLVVHAHDWHAALAPVYLRHSASHGPVMQHLPCVVTVHNGGFQGLFPPYTLGQIGLPERLWTPEFMEWYGHVNFLKGGVLSADMVTTVSRTHAEELCTEVGGFGLDAVFRNLGDRLVGIRNGIDTESWDPAHDAHLPATFRDDLAGKHACKEALRRAWNLAPGPAPLFALSARLVSQKGIDLVLVSRAVRDLDAQFVFLGSGEPRYEVALAELAAAFPGRIAVNTAFTDALEHRLLAGADFLLMPSLYEPCGLTQMRAQVYGSLPVARRVGGLSDTIEDGRTGILFDAYTPEAFDAALHRAIELYGRPELFREQVRAAMGRDFSWCEPASAYAAVYRRAYAARAAARAAIPPTSGRGPRRVRELSGVTPV